MKKQDTPGFIPPHGGYEKPSSRRSARLAGYDYTLPGIYFVTICTHGQRCLLGVVEGGRMVLSDVGRIVEECWKEIPRHSEYARTGAFQIMPNHLHGVIEIVERVLSTPTSSVGAQHVADPGVLGRGCAPTDTRFSPGTRFPQYNRPFLQIGSNPDGS